jgi:hypothetical protein
VTWIESPQGQLDPQQPFALSLTMDPTTLEIRGLTISQTSGQQYDWVSRP